MAESNSKADASIDPDVLVTETESGARNPTGAISKKILFYVPLIWTLFQLWYASPLPFIFNFFVINDTEARAIHLAFAIFLSYTAYPAFKSSPRSYIQDWIVALVATFYASYFFWFYAALEDRRAIPPMDLVVSITGLVLSLEATFSIICVLLLVAYLSLVRFACKAKGEDFAFKTGFDDLITRFFNGARNMVGIVVGTVTLNGIGLVMTEFVEFISGGNLMLILLFTAAISMGLPTTANYIVVSTLMVPVIVDLGAQNSLIVPLVAAHLFVFYFGILAGDTPPVGLATFSATTQGYFLTKNRIRETASLLVV